MKCPACNAPVAADARFCGNCGRSLAAQASVVQSPAGAELSSLYTVDSNVKTSPPESQALSTGAVLASRYTIKAALAGSGSIDIYLAHDRIADTDIHLKVLRPDQRLGAAMRQQFLREGAAARDLRHHSIAAVYDAGESDGVAYFAMEAVEGVTLRDWNRRRLTSGAELGISSVSAIIFAILDAIKTIHIRNLVRVDLKPANIALLSDPAQPGVQLKLTDVGVPYQADGNDSAATGFGASPYRAPEALTASNADLQASADIYSVSMIFYELLTGVPLAGHWQAPSVGRKDVPLAVDVLIQNGLSNNPRRRQQSVEEYRQSLEKALGALKDDPRPSPRPGPAPTPDPKPDPKPAPSPMVVDTWKIPDFLAPILKMINMPFVLIVMVVQNFVSWIEILIFASRPLPLGERKAARGWITALVSVALIAVVGLGAWGAWALLNSRNAVAVANLDGAPPQTAGPAELPDIPPELNPPPPPPSRYASFNGYWTDDFGDTWSVTVDDNGQVRALASGGMFAGSEMAGVFSGQRFEFAVGNAYGIGESVGTFDGQCHIRYQTLDPYGSGRTINASLHINHPAGGPCP